MQLGIHFRWKFPCSRICGCYSFSSTHKYLLGDATWFLSIFNENSHVDEYVDDTTYKYWVMQLVIHCQWKSPCSRICGWHSFASTYKYWVVQLGIHCQWKSPCRRTSVILSRVLKSKSIKSATSELSRSDSQIESSQFNGIILVFAPGDPGSNPGGVRIFCAQFWGPLTPREANISSYQWRHFEQTCKALRT